MTGQAGQASESRPNVRAKHPAAAEMPLDAPDGAFEQELGGHTILMDRRALARVAASPGDCIDVYRRILEAADQPVILLWLGEVSDPGLDGYWGSQELQTAMHTCLDVIGRTVEKVDGIKISLLDKNEEIQMRRLLPDGVRMDTGDDFNYPELLFRLADQARLLRDPALAVARMRSLLSVYGIGGQ